MFFVGLSVFMLLLGCWRDAVLFVGGGLCLLYVGGCVGLDILWP